MRLSERCLSKTLVGWSYLPVFFRDCLAWRFFFIQVFLVFWLQTTFNVLLFLKSLKVCAFVCVKSLLFIVFLQIIFAISILIVVSLQYIYNFCLWPVLRILQPFFLGSGRLPFIAYAFIRSYELLGSGFSSILDTTPLVYCVPWVLPIFFFCSVRKLSPSSFYVLLFISAFLTEIWGFPSWILVLLSIYSTPHQLNF